MGAFFTKEGNPPPPPRNDMYAAPPRPPQPMPGWSAYTTQVDGRPRWYFVNNATGVSSWTLPAQPEAPQSAVSSSARKNLSPWEKNQNEFIKKYYKNTKGPGPKNYKDDPRYSNIQ